MIEIYYLTKRNFLVYVRDMSAVFFSALSMLVVLGLTVIFLGKMNSESLVELLAGFGNRDTAGDERNAAYLIQLWTLSGILSVNCVTVTLTVLGVIAQDETGKRTMAFYVTPVNRIKLSLGYVLSAWISGIVMSALTLAAGEIYFLFRGNPLLTASVVGKLLCMTALNAFIFSAVGYLLALFVRSGSAWSGLLTIIGTLVGFVGGIYLPLGSLGEGLQKVLKCLPVLPGAAMMRRVCTDAAIADTFLGLPEIAAETFRKQMGILLYWKDKEMTPGSQLAILLGYAITAITASALINRKRKLRDR